MLLQLFLWNILLTILHSACLILSICIYLKYKKNIFLYLAIIFILYLFDNTIIFIMEMFPTVYNLYTITYLSSPVIKIVMYGLLGFSYLNIFHLMATNPIKTKNYICYSIFLIIIIISPTLLNNIMGSNIFYHTIQLYFIVIAYSQFSHIKNTENRDNRLTIHIIKAFILLNCLIIFEDIYVINFIDSYTITNVNIFYRSFSENIMTLIIASFTIYYIIKNMIFNFEDNTDKEKEIKSLFVEKHDILTFASEYNLTDREKEILEKLMELKNAEEISGELHLSIGTIKTHIHNIYIKTNVSKKRELISLYNNFHINKYPPA